LADRFHDPPFGDCQLLAAVTKEIDIILLALAMAALGLATHISSMRKAGFKRLLFVLIFSRGLSWVARLLIAACSV
jgi:uncharacterized membrane protein YadS